LPAPEFSQVFSGTLEERLWNDEIVNVTPLNLFPLVTEEASEFLANTNNAVLRTQDNNRFRSLFNQLLQSNRIQQAGQVKFTCARIARNLVGG
jgi:hypothetical protein